MSGILKDQCDLQMAILLILTYSETAYSTKETQTCNFFLHQLCLRYLLRIKFKANS